MIKKILILLLFLIPVMAQDVSSTQLTEQNLKEATFYSRIQSGNNVYVGESDATPGTDRNGYSDQARVNTITKAITQANALTPGVGNQVTIWVRDARAYLETETLPDYVDLIYWNASIPNITSGTTSSDIIQSIAAVTSVFGRIGAVVAATSDYDAVQVDNTPFGVITATNVQGAIDTLESRKYDIPTNTMDDISNGITYVKTTNDYTTAEKNKLTGIEPLAEVNNLTDNQADSLTNGLNTTLHYHDAVLSISSDGGTDRVGDIDLIGGTNVTITDNADGSFTINSSGGGGATKLDTIIYKIADESVVSSTTLQDDDDFAFTLEANTNYSLEWVIFYSTESSADLKVSMTSSSSVTNNRKSGFALSQSGTSETDIRSLPSYGTITGVFEIGGLGFDRHFTMNQFIETGVSSTNIVLTWAQFSSLGVPTVLRRGSYVHIKEQ